MGERPIICDGATEAGRTLRIEGEKPYDLRVWIDGEEAIITEPRSIGIRLYRDGGTIEIDTDRGLVRLPHRIGDPDHRPRLDGEIVHSDA